MFRKSFFLVLLIILINLQGFSQSVTGFGTDFWVAFQPNDTDPTLFVIINSDNLSTGNISSAFNSYSQDFTVTPGTTTEITVPANFCAGIGTSDKGLHIVSDLPISVACINYSSLPLTSDGYLALPDSALGQDYYIMSCHGQANNMGSMLSVVSTHDATNVYIFNIGSSLTEHVILNRGQVYQTSGQLKDLTGSRVQSDYPVAVFGSNLSSSIPLNCVAADCIVEEMAPTQAWGKEFYTVSLGGRELDGDVFRILAMDSLTLVKINDTLVATLDRGDYFETDLSGMNFILTSNPVMVAQFAKSYACAGSNGLGDPFMMLIPPRQQYATEFLLGTIPGFMHWVNIIASPNAVGNIYQDGNLISSSLFSEIGSSGYAGARLSITPGYHSFMASAPYQVFSYGWGGANSYGYPAGGSFSHLSCLGSMTISPDSACGILNMTDLCFTATVKDGSDQPIQGILVDFRIRGMGELLKNSYTDSLGQAHFCYTRTGNVPGIDSIYAETSDRWTTTSRAYWVTCKQPGEGGVIGHSQSDCGSFTPAPVINITAPSGNAGELEYQWQISTTGSLSGFSDIPASNSPGYSPGLLTQSTWFKRLSRVTCATAWPAGGISNVVEMTIRNQFTPEITISPSSNPYCEGSQVTVRASGVYGGTQPGYHWILNGSSAGSDTDALTWLPSPGDSIRCVFTSSLACVTVNPVSSQQVILFPDLSHPAGITISASPNPFCQGKKVTLTATPLNGGTVPSFQWRANGLVSGPDTSSWSYIPLGNDVIDCRLTSNLDCVSGNPVLSLPVTLVESSPVAKFSVTPTDTTLSWPLITFTDESTGTTDCQIDWGDGTITGCDSIHHRYSTTGTFTIKEVVASDAGCSDSTIAHVVIRADVIKPEYSLYIPNAFTPDGDGLNDVFSITWKGIENFSLMIFSRDGKEIFSTNDPGSGWDGRFRGQPCSEGAYVYKIEFTEPATGGKKLYSGPVYLLRKR